MVTICQEGWLVARGWIAQNLVKVRALRPTIMLDSEFTGTGQMFQASSDVTRSEAAFSCQRINPRPGKPAIIRVIGNGQQDQQFAAAGGAVFPNAGHDLDAHSAC